MDHIGNLLQLTDAVVHEIDLPIARHLEVDSISDNLCTESMYFSLNGIAVGGRCLNDAKVTSPDERELEGTRYRRSRHRQCINIRLQLAQFLFRRDTEFLLLIDDEQAKVLKLHRLADEFMRTYYNIYLTVCQIFQQRSGLLGAAGTRQIIHTNRHILQATCKSTKMLIGKYRRRHEYSHLFTIGSSLERSAHLSWLKAKPFSRRRLA